MEYTYIYDYNGRTVFHGDTAIGYIDEDNRIYDSILPVYLEASDKIAYIDSYQRDKLRDASGAILGYIDDYNNVLDQRENKVGYLSGELIYADGIDPVGMVVGPSKRAGAAAFLLMHDRFHSRGVPYYPVDAQYTQSEPVGRYHAPRNWAKDEQLSTLKVKMTLLLILAGVSVLSLLWLYFSFVIDVLNFNRFHTVPDWSLLLKIVPVTLASSFLVNEARNYGARYYACQEDEEYRLQNGTYPNYRWYEGKTPHLATKIWWVTNNKGI